MCKFDLLKYAIESLIDNASLYNLKIDGVPSQNWFVIRDVRLAPVFSSNKCDIMFTYGVDGRVKILFPEHIQMNFEAYPSVCPCFLGSTQDVKGWQEVCPYIAQLSHGFLYVGIPAVLQFITNPILCGIQGCDARYSYEKLWADFDYEWPSDEKEDFKYEIDTDDKEK